MQRARCLIVIGASAGGIEPLGKIIQGVPADLPAAICAVVHIPPTRDSLIDQVIGRRAQLPTRKAYSGMKLEEGRVYVAPPDRHLWVDDGRLRLLYGPKENGLRPAIDPTFRSAASAYGSSVVGVLLSGMHDDGVVGLRIVREKEGVAIVQDPTEADFPYLPLRALEENEIDHVCKVADMIPLLVQLAHERSQRMVRSKMKPVPIETEKEEVAREKQEFAEGGAPGTATGLTCPDCGGAIWEFDKEGVLQFRCHVGHVYSSDSFVDEQAKTVEMAMWTALRALEEKEMLLKRLASRARDRGAELSVRQFETAAEAVAEKIGLIRRAIDAAYPPSNKAEPAILPAASVEEA